MKQKIAVILIAVLILGGLLYWERQERMTDQAFSVENLIRFHVIANSNSSFDQSVKYQIRDRLVEALRPSLSRARSYDEALRIIREQEGLLTRLADQVLQEKGCGYRSHLETGRYSFPARAYGKLVLPAGNYEAVRVVLGKGEGKNWWCVLFPPLCFVDISRTSTGPAAQQVAEMVVAEGAVSSSEAQRVLGSEKVQLRFKLVDWLKEEQGRLVEVMRP